MKWATVHELLAQIEQGDTSANEVLDAYRERCSAAAPLNLLRHEFTDVGDRAGPFHGIPYLTKANIAVRQQPLDCASAILEGYRSPYDAAVTRRLRDAGATCLGSTNMDEFGMGSSSELSVQGAVEHPFAEGRVVGGSSGGAAAAVAAGAVPFALGSDTGGSVRQPAANCGLVGLKPTWGRVSRSGLVAFASSFDQIGPLTLDVRDAAWVLERLCGLDEHDSTTSRVGDSSFESAVQSAPKGLRIGLIEVSNCSAAITSNLGEVADALSNAGAIVERVSLDSLNASLAAYAVIAYAEASSNLARFDGTLYGKRADDPALDDMVRRTRNDGFGAEVKLRLMLGSFVLSAGWSDKYVRRAQRFRQRLKAEVNALLESCDVLMLPTTPHVAAGRGELLDDPVAMRQSDRFTVLANLTGHPAMAVPSGADGNGAAISVQFIGKHFDEATMLRAAASVESLVDIASLRRKHWSDFWWEGAR